MSEGGSSFGGWCGVDQLQPAMLLSGTLGGSQEFRLWYVFVVKMMSFFHLAFMLNYRP